MKTEGLTFLEAVQALHDGMCEKIQSPNGAKYSQNHQTITLCGFCSGIYLDSETFLGEWKLIGVKPIKQKVVIEGVSWKQLDSGLIFPTVLDFMGWNTLLGKPKMKMTLEWEE